MEVYNLCEEYVHIYVKNYIHMNRSVMTIWWDNTNEFLHNRMIYESNLLYVDDSYVHSCFWVNTIKDMTNWEPGMTIYMNVRSWGLEKMTIEYSSDIFNRYYSIINTDGYFLVKEYIQDIGYGELYKFPCLYNELLDADTEPYILK